MKKPSVTELLKLLDKPALLGWANKQGLLGVDISEKRKVSLSQGNSIHNEIELHFKQNKPFENEEIGMCYSRFVSNKNILAVEKDIETEYFTGRIDSIIEYDNRKFIIDYKRSKGKVYLENKLQLVAYSMAEECDSFAIVVVPNFTFIEVQIKDRKPYEEILKSLSNIYNQKQLLNYE